MGKVEHKPIFCFAQVLISQGAATCKVPNNFTLVRSAGGLNCSQQRGNHDQEAFKSFAKAPPCQP